MTAHRHSRLDESLLRSIERPPEVSTQQVLLVRFLRGEGCCADDLARECTAVYTTEGELIGVIDPAQRNRKATRDE